MHKKLLYSEYLKDYFKLKDYNCIPPYHIVNNNDTVFVTSGIQPLLYDYQNSRITNNNKIYLQQPVIRTQFVNSINEGSSIAFTNLTTAGFNITEQEHMNLVSDWMELFYKLGMSPSDIFVKDKDYIRKWGNLLVEGKKKFYYYKNVEIGDTTFFTNITREGQNIGIETMSDLGFGLERIRWCISKKSYFDLYSRINLEPEVKAYLSALALLTVNDIKPSNKNSGYRFRLFAKKLVSILEGNDLSEQSTEYLLECIKYWKNWQEQKGAKNIETIKREYIRNCNRYIIDKLEKEGYNNLSKIDINISKEELRKRLISSNVESDKVKKLIK